MDNLSNKIILRPRFRIELSKNKKDVLAAFSKAAKTQNNFVIKCIDNHLFIKSPKEKEHIWSPQLHLEVNTIDKDSTCSIKGLFGPNPVIWTFFMFLHFAVATAFFIFGIWTYTNWSLKTSYTLPLITSILMIVLWFLLYFLGRTGKAKGKPEMQELHEFMSSILSKIS